MLAIPKEKRELMHRIFVSSPLDHTDMEPGLNREALRFEPQIQKVKPPLGLPPQWAITSYFCDVIEPPYP